MKHPLEPIDRKLMLITLVILFIGSACLCNTLSFTPGSSTPPFAQPTGVLSASPTSQPEEPTSFLSASPTSEIVQDLTSTGSWLLVKTSVGLWATNEDGSGLMLLTQGDNWASDLAAAVQPFGDQVVVLTSSDDGFPSLSEHHLALNLLSLPDGSLRKITDLTSPQTEPGPSFALGDANWEAVRAIMEQSCYAWSPDGTKLAFIGVMDGPSADVYLFDTTTDQITRVSQDGSQNFNPSWSPDGNTLFYFGALTFGTGAGATMSGAWAANGDGTNVTPLYQPITAGEILLGWRDNETVVLESVTMQLGENHLRLFNLRTQEETVLIDETVTCAAVASESSVDPGAVMYCMDDGLYLLHSGESQAGKISGNMVKFLYWIPQGSMFEVIFQNGTYITYEASGSNPQESPIPVPSNVAMYGAIYAWTTLDSETEGIWISGPGIEPMQVFNGPAAYPVWDRENNLLFFSWLQGGELDLHRSTFDNWYSDAAPVAILAGDVQGVTWVGIR
jgi:hypothetical protein